MRERFRWRRARRGALGVLASVATTVVASGCVAARPQPAQLDRWAEHAVAGLEARGDADSLWLGAMLSQWTAPGHRATAEGERRYSLPARSVALAERAAAAAPDDPLVANVRMRICAEVEGCEVLAAAARVRELEPGNAAAWEYDLRAATTSGDPAAVDAVLQRMANSEGFHLHWNAAVTRGAKALEAVAPHLPHHSLFRAHGVDARTAVNGLAAGRLLPRLQELGRACRDAGGSPGRRDDCLAIARRLQAGDTLIGEGFGLTLELLAWPEGTPERAAVVERRRTFDWRLERSADLMAPGWPWSVRRRLEEYAELQSRLPREQDVVLALLQRRGVPPDPPASWTRAADRAAGGSVRR